MNEEFKAKCEYCDDESKVVLVYGLLETHYICKDCHFSIKACSNCKDTVRVKSMNFAFDENGSFFCKKCSEKKLVVCSNCEIIINKEYEHFSEVEDETYCESCTDELED